MILRNLGPDNVEELDGLTQADWVAYHYTAGAYDGYGEACWFIGGKLYYKNLSHCSCFGPAEDDYGSSKGSIPDDMDYFVIDKGLVLSDGVTDSPIGNAQLQLTVTALLQGDNKWRK